MFKLIHISDLHRTGDDPLTNSEIANGIFEDIKQEADAGEDFRTPNALVVSGDIVQGVRLSDREYPASLEKQHEEALKLLIQLTDKLVDGDRSKVVILPGNHDVDRVLAGRSMNVVEDPSALDVSITKELMLPKSKYRWCWRRRELLEITDWQKYDAKMDFYRKTVQKFYHRVQLAFPLDHSRPWNHFRLDDDVVITAFDNCKFLDGYRVTANIFPVDVADANAELNSYGFQPSLKIAAWHHNINGPPMRSDYLDSTDLNAIVNCGYRVGLHGHQHQPDVLPHSIHTSIKNEMAIVSVGSLGAAKEDLPHGCNQQFNLIRVNEDFLSARIWVREMISRGIFGPGTIKHRANKNYFDISWPAAAQSQLVRTNTHGGIDIEQADEIENVLREEGAEKALLLLEQSTLANKTYGHSLKTQCLFELGDWEPLIQHVGSPKNPEQTSIVFEAMMRLARFPEATDMLDKLFDAGIINEGMKSELKGRVVAEQGMKK